MLSGASSSFDVTWYKLTILSMHKLQYDDFQMEKYK